MKKSFPIMLVFLILISLVGCASPTTDAQIATTTLPVYTFTSRLCSGTPLTVTQLITENVSCLHDYSLQVRHMRAIEAADIVVISGAGLEEFMEDALHSAKAVLDASEGLSLLEAEAHEHDHEHDYSDGHVHAEDPHIWLSPVNAKVMAQNIYHGLSQAYPEHTSIFHKNLELLLDDLDALQHYGEETLSDLLTREMVTFHDGFSYLAESFDLHILRAVEEESGSEASASELIALINLVHEHSLPAIFTEHNGSVSAAGIISSETGAHIFELDMCMAGEDYFAAMYHNIDTIREALQ